MNLSDSQALAHVRAAGRARSMSSMAPNTDHTLQTLPSIMAPLMPPFEPPLLSPVLRVPFLHCHSMVFIHKRPSLRVSPTHRAVPARPDTGAMLGGKLNKAQEVQSSKHDKCSRCQARCWGWRLGDRAKETVLLETEPGRASLVWA